MPISTILVPITAGPSSEAHLQAAVALGRAHSAVLIGMCAEHYAPTVLGPTMTPLDVTGGIALAERKLVDQDIQLAHERFLAATRGMEPEALWRGCVEIPNLGVQRNAATADLIVLGRTANDAFDIHRHIVVSDVIMNSGLPVLNVPAGGMALEPRKIAIAWKNTRQARRAVGDALPLLRRAEELVVYSAWEHNDRHEAAASLKDVVSRLARHGVKATGIGLPRAESPGRDILNEAARCGVDLIVTGAYGRSRLGEWIFGGVTETFLAEATIPVLFSH